MGIGDGVRVREKESKEGDKAEGPGTQLQNKKDQKARWKGLVAKREKRGRVVAIGRGRNRKEPGRKPLGWRLDGLGPILGYSLASHILFCFAK